MRKKSYARKRRKMKRAKSSRAIRVHEAQVIRDSSQAPEVGVSVVDPIGFASNGGSLLEKLKNQWQVGDWEALRGIDQSELSDQPNKERLALLAAAGKLQCGETDAARKLIQLAMEWGCDKERVAQLLIAGVYSTLARCAMINEEEEKTAELAETAIRLVTPTADLKLMGNVRTVHEATRLGFLSLSGKQIEKCVDYASDRRITSENQLRMLQTEVQLLKHELVLSQKNNVANLQDAGPAATVVAPDQERKDELARMSVSQLGQDLWVAERSAFKKDGFFVEFGASDGILLSNTYLLERALNWRGICCEPNPHYFKELQANRRCIVRDDFVAGRSGDVVQFALAGVYGGDVRTAYADPHAEKRRPYIDAGLVLHVHTVSLDELLSECNAPRDIDYISIDTEGTELEIVRNFPFDKWNVRLFTIEHNNTDQKDLIRKIMEDNGYTCRSVQWEDWFEKCVPGSDCPT